MAWLAALIKAILEWATVEIKKDTKASDADDVPKDLKYRWKQRIEKQLNEAEKQKNENNNKNSGDS